MSDYCTPLQRSLAKTVQRTAAEVPKTSKEKQAAKRAQDMPPPSRETRLRGGAPFGKR